MQLSVVGRNVLHNGTSMLSNVRPTTAGTGLAFGMLSMLARDVSIFATNQQHSGVGSALLLMGAGFLVAGMAQPFDKSFFRRIANRDTDGVLSNLVVPAISTAVGVAMYPPVANAIQHIVK